MRETDQIHWPRPFEGLRGVKRADLPREISAGITLAALIIPLNIGYAQVAGLPATMGLYAAIIPLVIFPIFTSSRHLVGGTGPATAAASAEAVQDALHSFYANEPFVAVIDAPPQTKSVLGSNGAHVSARFDERTGTVVAMCAIDNLTKGASGGAVQAANVALGLEETAGLTSVGVAP